MIVKDDFEQDDNHDDQRLNSNQQPDLQEPVLEEHGMHEPLKEGLNPEHNGHQDIRGLEPVHVVEKISGQLAILIVVAQVAADGHQDEDEHEEDAEDFHHGGGRVEAEHQVEGPEPKKGEVFEVALEEHINYDQAEGVWP